MTYQSTLLIFQATLGRNICMKSMQRSRTGHSGGNLSSVIRKNLKKAVQTENVLRQGS